MLQIRQRNADDKSKERDPEKKVEKRDLNQNEKRLIFFMTLFFFLYVGSEVVIGLFLTAFSVTSKLKTTKQDGADVTAIYWATFASMRFAAIFAAIKFKPSYIITMSFVCCLIPSAGMIFYAECSLFLLKVILNLLFKLSFNNNFVNCYMTYKCFPGYL